MMVMAAFCWSMNNLAMDIEKPTSLAEILKTGDFKAANALIEKSDASILFSADKLSGRLPFDAILSYTNDANEVEKKRIEAKKKETAELYLQKAGDRAYLDILYHKDDDNCSVWRKIVGYGNPEIIKAAVNVAQKRTEIHTIQGDSVRELMSNFHDEVAPYKSPLSYAVMEEKDEVVKVLLESAYARNPELSQDLVQMNDNGPIIIALEWMQSILSKEPEYAWFANSLLGKTFIQDAPKVRVFLMKYASQTYLKKCFQAILDQFHDVQEQKRQGQVVKCEWLAPALLEFNQIDSNIYPLSKEDCALFNKD
jgi:hypothetical protein